jgi:phage terminase Nu1 subunit (DNA packaging protein)
MTDSQPAGPAETEREPLMSRDELARLFTVTPGTIHRWDRDGMPRAVGGGSGRQALYRPSACVTWRQGQIEAKFAGLEGLNPQVERAKRDRAQGRLAEQLHRRREGDLLERADVQRGWLSIVLAVRSRLLRMPTSLADACAAATTPAEIERILTAEMRGALTELSNWTPPTEPTTPPATTAGRKRSPR